MPVDGFSWSVPGALKTAYEYRKEIGKAWGHLLDVLPGRSIAFTGIAGIGKTVLFDYLSGDAYKQGYEPPLASVTAEKGKLKSVETNKRLRITVVPGDASRERHEALDSIFLKGKHVEGVIHVVANGYVDVRNEFSREFLIKEAKLKTLDAFAKYQRRAELDDLNRTCELIRSSMNGTRRPKWMMVAVTKADLYQGDLESVKRYYSPNGKGPFANRLRELQTQVGSDNLRCEALPVCTWLTDFHWNGETRTSTLKAAERDSYLEQFAKGLERFRG